MPKEIRIIGSTPTFRFSTSMNINEMLVEMIEDAFGDDDGIKIFDCPGNTDTQTYLIHMMAIDQEFETCVEIQVLDQIMEVESITFRNDLVLYSSEKDENPLVLPLAGLGELLNGFNFNPHEIKARLYLHSNHEIIEDVKMDIDFFALDEDGKIIDPNMPLISLLVPKSPAIKIEPAQSGIDLDSKIYPYAQLPEYGIDIDDFALLLNEKKEFKVNIKVIHPAYTPIQGSVFDNNLFVSAEVVVWLPLDFIVNEGAKLEFPSDFFEEIDDIINSATNPIDSLNILLGFSNNTFDGGLFILKQVTEEGGKLLEIINSLNAQSLNISISSTDIKKIRGLGSNFKPDIFIYFPVATTLKFPRELSIISISLSANIDYILDLRN